MNTLLIIDVQNDFCPGGRLAVKDGDAVVPIINQLMDHHELVIATQDWHPSNHKSFASQHPGKQTYDITVLSGIEQVLWPDHCVQGSVGAGFHAALHTENIDLILRKGTHTELDSYSAFFENDKMTPTGLNGYLQGLNISEITICGLATDFCVFYSAWDARRLGYKVTVVEDACRGVDFPQGSTQKALSAMISAGVQLIHSWEFPR